MKIIIQKLIAGMLVACTSAVTQAQEKPNLLVIIADDLGFSDLGCYGAEHIQTPNLDSLAENGLRYTNFYNAARCWPTRISLMTGYYHQQTNLKKKKLPCIPHFLKPLGYRTYHTGKWHVTPLLPVKDGGFDRSYFIEQQDNFFEPSSKDSSLDDKPIQQPEQKYSTRVIADYALRFLEEHQQDHAKSPFFLYLAFTAPHFPLHAEQEDIDIYRDAYLEGWDRLREKRNANLKELGLMDVTLPDLLPSLRSRWSFPDGRLKEQIGPGEGVGAVPWETLDPETQRFQATKMAIHAAMIHRMDLEIGRVLDYLKKTGQYDNTLVMFLSDNGATAEQIIRGGGHDKAAPLGSASSYLCLGPGWSTAANTPFQYHKSFCHEGGACTPLIVHWPAGIKDKGAIRSHQLGDVVDLLPTLLDAAGGTMEEGHPGVSLLPSIQENQAVDKAYIYLNHDKNKAIRIGDWKAVMTPHHGKKEWELYNLANDRTERVNLASSEPERLKSMIETWEQVVSGEQ